MSASENGWPRKCSQTSDPAAFIFTMIGQDETRIAGPRSDALTPAVFVRIALNVFD
jgi:hypothetical protein